MIEIDLRICVYLQVTSQDPSLIQVLPLDSSSKETSVDYEIKLMTDVDFSINTRSITFKSGLTGQTATLKVLIESTPAAKPEQCIPTVVPGEPITHTNYFRSTAKEYGPWLVLYTILIATIILLVLIYHSFVSRRNQQSSFQQGSPNDPMMMTPVPGSAATHTPGSVVRGQPTHRRSPHETTPGVRNLFSVGQ